MTAFWLCMIVYLAVGLIFVVISGSRGWIADLLFALLWPVYLWMYLRHGW